MNKDKEIKKLEELHSRINQKDLTTAIRIKRTTKERLDSLPLGKQTYDDIINRLIDENQNFKIKEIKKPL
jgi:hypothetical protein